MRNKRRQERFALSRFALPVTVIYGALATLAAGVIEQELWLQTAALFAATMMMVFLNNRYSLIRVYSRMVSCSYLVLMTMACFLFPSIHGAIIELAFIAACMFLFNAYQNPRGSGAVFYAFAMIGISSIFFVQILYYVPLLWFVLSDFLFNAFLHFIWCFDFLNFAPCKCASFNPFQKSFFIRS